MLTAPVHLFQERCAIHRSASARDEYGAEVEREEVVAGDVSCRTARPSAGQSNTYGADGTRATLQVFFDATVDVREGDMLMFTDGLRFLRKAKVLGVNSVPPFHPVYQRADCEEVFGDYPDGR